MQRGKRSDLPSISLSPHFFEYMIRKRSVVIVLSLMIVGAGAVACAQQAPGDHPGRNIVAAKPVNDVLKEHTKELMSIPGVVGTAAGQCDHLPCIKVYVVKKTPDLERKIPRTLDGYAVMLEETGEIRAIPKER
jgi:hypothetical protein